MSPQSYAKQREIVIQWLNTILPDLRLPTEASDEELRACLIDGTVLCRILNRLSPSSPNEESSENSSVSQPENVKRFLATMDELGIPRFEGSMKTVVYCLLSLKLHFISSGEELSTLSTITKAESTDDDGSSPGSLQQFFGEEMRNAFPGLKLQCAMHNQVISEPSPAVLKHVGHKFHEVFQLKQACYADLPMTKILEMMESNSLEVNAPTQALLNVVYGILDETAETMNGKIPHHVACLLRKAVQEMGRRLSTQADHLRTVFMLYCCLLQNNLYRAHEEKHRSKIKELEALVSVSRKETKTANSILEEQEVEKQELMKLVRENEKNILELAAMRQELDIVGMVHKFCSLEMEAEAKAAIAILQLKIKELECLLTDSNNKVKELEASFESKCQSWTMKEKIYQSFIDFQSEAMQKLRSSSEAIKQEVLETQKRYSFEFNHLESKLKAVTDAAGNYHEVLKENHKLFSELQDLKGNIRIYCQIRLFLPGQTEKLSTIENISENGQLVIANPSKPGKDGQRSFKFNKVFGPDATQGEVFADIQPFVKSVVDGYNTGPTGATEEEWGVNYLVLNHLFKVSQDRKSNTVYEVAVQMVEIYNEQVRDLLSSDAVPEACMHPIISTSNVLDLMDIRFKNRAVSATALNARSSRSHNIVTVHVRGRNVKTGTVLYGNLHLIDLAGSERVDRSEVTGHRLREAQHINKSLSSLGDVIFALAKKSPHVPYRNSKLTQVLQSSLEGQAKTIMLVQLNPDATSFSEISGVELGAAQSSKEEKDVRELLEQMASLKDKIAEKDEEIRRLKSLRDLKPRIPQQQQL
ncbi:hypothetical protein ERO13_A07G172732v2 [Gossypium hirsutum]|nr:hypothetical protein ERO13_A07G172732v2 [Gossypium hirsutum]